MTQEELYEQQRRMQHPLMIHDPNTQMVYNPRTAEYITAEEFHGRSVSEEAKRLAKLFNDDSMTCTQSMRTTKFDINDFHKAMKLINRHPDWTAYLGGNEMGDETYCPADEVKACHNCESFETVEPIPEDEGGKPEHFCHMDPQKVRVTGDHYCRCFKAHPDLAGDYQDFLELLDEARKNAGVKLIKDIKEKGFRTIKQNIETAKMLKDESDKIA